MTGKGGYGVEGLSKKEKGLMDMDNSVVIIGGGDCKGAKWSWKNTIKKVGKKKYYLNK